MFWNSFNFENKLTQWVKMMYQDRNSYVINNGFLTKSIALKKGVFQGCPISPYLFLLVTMTTALAIRENVNIKGIPIDNRLLEISLLQMIQSVFWMAPWIPLATYSILFVLAVKLILPNLMLSGLVLKKSFNF